MTNEEEPEGFDRDHYNRKQERKQRRQKKQKGPGGKKMHRVEREERWQWNGKQDEEE